MLDDARPNQRRRHQHRRQHADVLRVRLQLEHVLPEPARHAFQDLVRPLAGELLPRVRFLRRVVKLGLLWPLDDDRLVLALVVRLRPRLAVWAAGEGVLRGPELRQLQVLRNGPLRRLGRDPRPVARRVAAKKAAHAEELAGPVLEEQRVEHRLRKFHDPVVPGALARPGAAAAVARLAVVRRPVGTEVVRHRPVVLRDPVVVQLGLGDLPHRERRAFFRREDVERNGEDLELARAVVEQHRVLRHRAVPLHPPLVRRHPVLFMPSLWTALCPRGRIRMCRRGRRRGRRQMSACRLRVVLNAPVTGLPLCAVLVVEERLVQVELEAERRAELLQLGPHVLESLILRACTVHGFCARVCIRVAQGVRLFARCSRCRTVLALSKAVQAIFTCLQNAHGSKTRPETYGADHGAHGTRRAAACVDEEDVQQGRSASRREEEKKTELGAFLSEEEDGVADGGRPGRPRARKRGVPTDVQPHVQKENGRGVRRAENV